MEAKKVQKGPMNREALIEILIRIPLWSLNLDFDCCNIYCVAILQN